MIMPRVLRLARRSVLCLGLVLAANEMAAEEAPRLRIAAPELGCPAIEGSFVAVLGGRGEALLLAPASFPGSRRDQPVDGGPVRVQLGESAVWRLQAASVVGGGGRMWSALYSTGGHGATGCVAFDAARFSSEGDLVSYLRWVVNQVYLRIPDVHRPPVFRLGDRQLELTIDQPGFKSMVASAKEGATLAVRIHGIDGVILIRAYPLDDSSSRFAVFVAAAERPFWGESEQLRSRFELVTAGQSFNLGEASATLRVRPSPEEPEP